MEFIRTELEGVLLLKPQIFGDARGFFLETYKYLDFVSEGVPDTFVQDNHSGSIGGTLRGLHYQIHQTQGKLVRSIVGEIFDVAVDLRRNSSTCGKWVGRHLSSENKFELWIPPGFAHGFYSLTPWAEVVYKATDYYAPEWERSLCWNDPTVGVAWPLIGDEPPKLSSKDAKGISFAQVLLFE